MKAVASIVALGLTLGSCGRHSTPEHRHPCERGPLGWVDRIEGGVAVVCGTAGCTDVSAEGLQEGDVLCGARASPAARAARVAQVKAAYGRLLADEAPVEGEAQW